MGYITFNEFKSITGKTDDYEKTFEQFYSKAAAVIDNITNRFYQLHKIDEDPITFRVDQFKLALCSQIEYFGELGQLLLRVSIEHRRLSQLVARVFQMAVDITHQELMRANL